MINAGLGPFVVAYTRAGLRWWKRRGCAFCQTKASPKPGAVHRKRLKNLRLKYFFCSAECRDAFVTRNALLEYEG